jgi:hypothetical protein
MGGATGGEASQRSAGRCATCLAAVIILVACRASATDVRVGWLPVPSVAGYRLYVRQLGQAYGPYVDVGRPQADGDGIIRYVAAGVPLLTTTYFALTAYDAAAQESPFSNELFLLAVVSASPTSPPGQASPTPSAAHTATLASTVPFTPTRTATAALTAPRTPTATPALPATATPTPTPVMGSGMSVSGNVRYYADDGPVSGATLTMQGPLGAMAATSDDIGDFRFNSVPQGVWALFPQKNGDLGVGISSYDAAYVLQTVSGMRHLTSIERLTCDVTGNGVLSALDASRILQLAVGKIVRLPAASRCGSDWVFVAEPSTLLGRVVDPQLTTSSCQPGSIVFEPLLGSAGQQNFVAAVFGDCTGNWTTGGSGAALRQTAPPARALLEAPRKRPGQRWLVPLHVEGRDTLDAFEARLAYNASTATLEDVQLPGATIDSMLDYRDTSGQVAIALAGTGPLALGERPLLVLVFSAADEPEVWLYDAVVDDAPAQIDE